MNAEHLRIPIANDIMIIMHDFSTGGTERIAIRLANYWAKNGRIVTILCGTQEGPARTLVSRRVNVIAVKPEIRRSLFSRVKLGMAMARAIRKLAPDIVFAPGNFHLSVIGIAGWKLGCAKPPIICKLSNPLSGRRSQLAQRLFVHIFRNFARPVDAFVAMSENLAGEANRFLGGKRIAVIPEPNLENDFARTEAVERETPPIILCLGRLEAQKNMLRAIQTFALIKDKTSARLLIHGEGDQRPLLEQEIARLDLADRVEMPGYTPDARSVLQHATLLLLSSDYEGYPAVLVEAIVNGCPVVTTRCSLAIDEIMTDPSFGKVCSNDVEDLADAIIGVLEGPSPDWNASAQLADRHRVGYAANKYLELFDELMLTDHRIAA